MLYEMIIMSSTSQLYCQTKMNLKKVRIIKVVEGLPKLLRVFREGLA